MKRSEKLARIREVLDRLVPAAPIPLAHRDPFTLLVAVVLSAQSTDKKVNEITPALFARADTPRKMARLSIPTVQGLIRQVGLAPAKARALVNLSKRLLEHHGGQVPQGFEELEALPGVGHKTAGVVRCQAFGLAAFPVDTHIRRLAWRWGLSNGKSVVQTERDLKRLFPEPAWARLHLQMIWFGRQYCPARGHDPQRCPICCFASPRSRHATSPRS